MRRIGKLGFVFCAVMLAITASCNKQFDRAIPSGAYVDSTKIVGKTPKVLYLIVDGARGWAVRDANATNINALTNSAIYSWNSISDSLSNDGNGWADLLTGVTKAKHKVIDNTFAGNNLSQFPTIFKRIKDERPDLRIATFSASSIFNTYLTASTNVSQLAGTDAAVTTAVVGELGNDSASVVVGEFNGVNLAGAASGYDNSFPAYKNAILQFDQYLGQMLTALKARKNYANENWLVVVTSNHGGPATIPAAQNDGTVFSYTPVNTFTIIYNKAYNPKIIDKPFTGSKYSGSFCRFYCNPNGGITNGSYPASYVKATVTNNNGVYNFGDTTSFTIELKVKLRNRGTSSAPNYSYNWPVLLSKKNSKTQKSSVGWAISREVTNYRFFVGNPANNHIGVNTAVVNDGNWHTLAFKVLNRNFHRYERAYTDGVFNAETQIPDNFGTIDDPASPLALGVIPTDLTNTFDGYISDVRIWKAPLPDAVISQYACNTSIDNTHPYWNYIIGYWPGNDGSGTIIKDLGPAHNDFNITTVGTGTPLSWDAQSDIVCPPPTTALSLLVPRSVDIPRQILSWLAIAPPDNWFLDGRVWLNN